MMPCAAGRPPDRPDLAGAGFLPNEFKNNVLALGDIAKFFNLPTILTTSFESGPNGPIVPELKEQFPDAPFIPVLARSTPGTTKTSSRR
jgi:hypothetical protein